MGKRVFVLTEHYPEPDKQAGDRRFVQLLEMMARHHRVDLCVWKDGAAGRDESERRRRVMAALGVRLVPAGWKHVAAVLATRYYDLAFFEFYYPAFSWAERVRRRQPGAKVIVDSVDVHFVREAAGARMGVVDPAQAERTRRDELAVYRAADAVITVTEADADLLRAEGGMPACHVVPLVMPPPVRHGAPKSPGEMVFVGGFAHLPNLDGLRWFIAEIWPGVKGAVPGAHLTVIGSNPPPEVMAFAGTDGVHVAGYVPDTGPYLERAVLSIAPLRFGAGMKGKVIEAMAFGLPVVTTSVGAQGLPFVSGEEFVVADDPSEFARVLVELLGDEGARSRLGAAGQAGVAALCGPAVVERNLLRALDEIAPGGGHGPTLGWRGYSLAFRACRAMLLPFHLARQRLARRRRPDVPPPRPGPGARVSVPSSGRVSESNESRPGPMKAGHRR